MLKIIFFSLVTQDVTSLNFISLSIVVVGGEGKA